MLFVAAKPDFTSTILSLNRVRNAGKLETDRKNTIFPVYCEQAAQQLRKPDSMAIAAEVQVVYMCAQSCR